MVISKGISQLITGMKIDDVISKLDGTRCGTKGPVVLTSCYDSFGRIEKQ